MNRECIKELLPVFEAFANGEDIQFIPNQYNCEIGNEPDWMDLPKDQRVTMTFPCEDYSYRIKPKPREFWINPDGSESIIYEAFDPKDSDFIKVREIL